MATVDELITENIDLWTSAIKRKSSAGRGSGKKVELYGVKKLRELILDLAVRGLLVPQESNDKPAIELLNRIAEEKSELVKAKKIKKQKPLAEISKIEKAYDLPDGWAWCRFGNFVFNRDAERVPLSVDERKTRSGPYSYYGASGVIDSIDDFIFDKPLLLIGEDGANLINRSTPIAFIANGEYWVNNHAHVLDAISFGVLEFTCLHINAISLKPYVTGTAQPKMNQAKMNSIVLAVPPEKEQNRIVAKVDELMALCDQLEQQTESSITAHQTLVKTLLGALTQAATQSNTQQSAVDSPTPFTQAWNRLAEHFDTVFTTEDSIEQLKQTILQLAVMGKLVPQDPNDEPASELLKRIAAEKAELVKAKKIKKQKALPEISEEEKPFALPDGWEWSRIFDASITTEYGISAKTFENIGGVPVLKMGDIQAGKVVLGNHKEADSPYEGIDKLMLEDGDILYNRTNSAELVGKTGVYYGPSDKYSFASYLIRIKSAKPITPEFINLNMNSPLFRVTQIEPHLKQQCGQANVNGTIMKNMVLAIAPENEQRNIVAKVQELLALCDQLKIRLSKAQGTQFQLADTVTERATQ